MGFYHFFYIYLLGFYWNEELPLLPHLLVGWFLSVWTDGFLFSLMDYRPFNIHAFYKCRGSRQCLSSSPLQPQPAEYGHECSHSQKSVVTFQYPLLCIGQGPLLIPESLSTARATGEGPSTVEGRCCEGRVSETGRTDWRQAGPGFKKRPCSLSICLEGPDSGPHRDNSSSEKLLEGSSLGKHLGPKV